jgi:hypothetical protein
MFKSVDYIDDGLQGSIKIALKYVNGKQTPVNRGLKRISKPRPAWCIRSEELPRVLGGLGIAIISTSKGLMTDFRSPQERHRRRSAGVHLVNRHVIGGGEYVPRIGKLPITVPAGVTLRSIATTW